MKKIVFLVPAIGNYNAYFFNRLAQDYGAEYKVYVIYSEDWKSYLPKYLDKRVEVIAAKTINLFSNKMINLGKNNPDSLTNYMFYYPGLSHVLDRIKPDIVSTMLYYLPYSLQAARYCKKKKIHFILSEELQREPADSLTRHINRIFLPLAKRTIITPADLVIASTRQGLEFQKKFLGGSQSNRFHHIPWIIDEEEFIKKKRNEVRHGKLRLIMIARLVPYKNHSTVIKALRLLKDRNVNFHMNMFGHGPLESDIRNEIKANGLDKNVDLITERQTPKQLEKFYSSSDILILASSFEAYGLVVPEAMAYGCAVVISDTAGTKFLVKDGVNGYHVKTGDMNDLADKIELTEKHLSAFKKASRTRMKNTFSSKSIISSYVKLLRKIS